MADHEATFASSREAWKQRIGRAWQGFFATMTTILAWKYLSPWVAWSIGIAYLVLALGFELYLAGMERHHD